LSEELEPHAATKRAAKSAGATAENRLTLVSSGRRTRSPKRRVLFADRRAVTEEEKKLREHAPFVAPPLEEGDIGGGDSCGLRGVSPRQDWPGSVAQRPRPRSEAWLDTMRRAREYARAGEAGRAWHGRCLTRVVRVVSPRSVREPARRECQSRVWSGAPSHPRPLCSSAEQARIARPSKMNGG